MSQFLPTTAAAAAEDGFGSCETVGFDHKEPEPMLSKNAKYCIGFAIFLCFAAYLAMPTDASQKLDPRLASPGGTASAPPPTAEQLHAQRDRLAKISKKASSPREMRSPPLTSPLPRDTLIPCVLRCASVTSV